MTREEAIEELKTRYLTMSQCFDREGLHKANKAIDIAIKSLEAWDKVKEGVDKLTVYHTTSQGSELLSKNAVIRLINKHIGE